MKHLLIAAMAVVLFTGCSSPTPNAGRPGTESYTEGVNDHSDGYPGGANDRLRQKSHLNLREGWNH